jgi:FixJ family two-component response regulator
MAAQKYTIAIVDDDASMLKALGRLLMENGYGVELFASFADVMKGIPSSKAICIVIDCQLGQFSGIDLARQLTASGFGFPIIFMTASDDDCVREQAMATGCAAFLRKPFFVNQLLEAVGKVAASPL